MAANGGSAQRHQRCSAAAAAAAISASLAKIIMARGKMAWLAQQRRWQYRKRGRVAWLWQRKLNQAWR